MKDLTELKRRARNLTNQRRWRVINKLQILAAKLIDGQPVNGFCQKANSLPESERKLIAKRMLEIAAELMKTLDWGRYGGLPPEWRN